MNMKIVIAMVAMVFASASAGHAQTQDRKGKAIKEIESAERDFQKMTVSKGLAEAFFFYADNNAVIKRENDTLIRGREAIRNYYSSPGYSAASVVWAPDYTDASAQGDMGYTFGRYTWTVRDSTGNANEYKGVFHTVWKKQPDGSWKYVWD
jgi:ketosteroid isomerase-like protein